MPLASWFANVDISEDRQIADDELLSFLSKSIDGKFTKPCLKDWKYFWSILIGSSNLEQKIFFQKVLE